MSVRNRTKKPNECEAHWAYVRSATCPCRPCYQPRDYTYYNSQRERVTQIECATRQDGGCPLPPPKPKHVSAEHSLFCKRCGALVFTVRGNEPNPTTREEEAAD